MRAKFSRFRVKFGRIRLSSGRIWQSSGHLFTKIGPISADLKSFLVECGRSLSTLGEFWLRSAEFGRNRLLPGQIGRFEKLHSLVPERSLSNIAYAISTLDGSSIGQSSVGEPARSRAGCIRFAAVSEGHRVRDRNEQTEAIASDHAPDLGEERGVARNSGRSRPAGAPRQVWRGRSALSRSAGPKPHDPSAGLVVARWDISRREGALSWAAGASPNGGRSFEANSGFQVAFVPGPQKACVGGVSPRWRPEKVA